MKNKAAWLFMAVAVVMIAVFIAYGNKNIGITTYELQLKTLPKSFEGMRVVQISDLHNADFGKDNSHLINAVSQAEPDMIFITGDMIDSRNTHIQRALSDAAKMAEIAPTYYVTGNHEARIKEYPAFEQGLEENGVVVLHNQAVSLEKNGERIDIIGLDDPAFMAADGNTTDEALDLLESGNFSILLAHRPDFLEKYAAHGMALVFSGHTHGGQIRLPILGGIYAPGLGFFPEYDGGVHSLDESTMVISRGIGNSLFPIRVNNDPEVVLVILK